MLYKTKNGQQTGFVPGVGEIVNGQIDGPNNLESANLQAVVETPNQEDSQTVPVAPVASPPTTVVPDSQTVQNTNTSTEVK